MKQVTKFGMALLILSFFSSCATIMKGGNQEMKVNSTPGDAKITVTNQAGVAVFEGKTPAKFKLKKDKDYVVTVSLDGYKDQKVSVSPGAIEGAFWGNICIGGVIGVVIDIAAGSWKKLEPNDITVNLTTASLDGKSEALYAVFTAKDSQGELRQMVVPMVQN
ncbi:MAG: PEGA domain-containing protein [Bacteroidetes bacterium]|nr:PEGA domain-containing protein [Bacteroidota bacterium]